MHHPPSARGYSWAGVRHLVRSARPYLPRRVRPVSDNWGFDRGTPIDRYYITQFLAEHAADVRGRVLEVQDSAYTVRFGGNQVVQRDVLDIASAANPCATIVADLAAADIVPADTFDCFLLTQTLHLLLDVRAGVYHAWRMLRPGGVLLVTVPVVSRLVRGPLLTTDYWRFTLASCNAIFGEAFGTEQVTLQAYGNVLTCSAFLMGLAVEELRSSELTVHDDRFPLVIGVRAVKAREHGQRDRSV
jgi:SAM-dependent methyltransferase